MVEISGKKIGKIFWPIRFYQVKVHWLRFQEKKLGKFCEGTSTAPKPTPCLRAQNRYAYLDPLFKPLICPLSPLKPSL